MSKPFVVEHKTFQDDRGNFCPSPLFLENPEIDRDWVQVNTSISPVKWTIRGLHYQDPPFEQAKYLKVIHGSIRSMILCIDKSKKDFGTSYSFEVNKDQAVMVPRGYANGLITLEENTVIQYFVDNPYSPKHEKSIFYGSVQAFQTIVSEMTDNPQISDKDLNGISFRQEKDPDFFETCILCKEITDVPKNMSVDIRVGYIEGAGQ